jgi:hypothetical protein
MKKVGPRGKRGPWIEKTFSKQTNIYSPPVLRASICRKNIKTSLFAAAMALKLFRNARHWGRRR